MFPVPPGAERLAAVALRLLSICQRLRRELTDAVGPDRVREMLVEELRDLARDPDSRDAETRKAEWLAVRAALDERYDARPSA